MVVGALSRRGNVFLVGRGGGAATKAVAWARYSGGTARKGASLIQARQYARVHADESVSCGTAAKRV